MKIELLYDVGSNCSQRLIWAMNFKDIPYTPIRKESLRPEQILAMSPLGKVPAVLIDGNPLAESIAILEYMEETFPENPLLPIDKSLRAKVREAAEIVNGTIHPLQSTSAVKFFREGIGKEEIAAVRRDYLEKTLPILEKTLFKDSKFAVGRSFSWADICAIPIYYKALGFGTPAQRFPKFVDQVRACFIDDKIRSACPEDLMAGLKEKGLF